jgi:bacillithiol synthase
LTVRILRQPLGGPRLVRDYLDGEPAAVAFFQGSHADPDAYAGKLAEIRTRFGREERQVAAAALEPTSAAARQRLERFVEEGGAFVTTGQQAGLLTGPLYTIHKALSAVRLAATLERRLGVLVLPVFWIASDDADWAEVNHIHLPTGQSTVRRIELSGPTTPPLPMSERTIGTEIETVLEEVEHAIRNEAFAAHYLDLVRRAYPAGATVAEGFRAMLRELLAPFDVCLVDAADPQLKRASVPLLWRALEEAATHEEVLARRSRELQTQGYHTQVPVLATATNVAYHGPAGRERLFRTDAGFVARESRRSFEPAELRAELERDPSRFSPTVFLRPVVESVVLPTLAYVAGPGEIGYFAQADALFECLDVRTPVVAPRFAATLVEPFAGRLLERLGLTVEELSGPAHEVVHALARRETPPEVQQALAELRSDLAAGFARLATAAAGLDPTLRTMVGARANRALAGVADAERRILRAVKRREATTVARVTRLRAHLRPGGEPQDRVLNVLHYLARYGPSLMEDLARAVAAEWEQRLPTPEQATCR